MKKTILAALIISSALLQSGCSNSLNNTASRAIEDGKLAMAGSDFLSALNYFQLAKNEGGSGSELDDLILMTQKYIEAQDNFNAANMDGAQAALDAIPESYTEYTIASSVDSLKKQVQDSRANMSDVDLQIAGVRKMIAAGDYVSASANVTELYSKKPTEYQRNQINELKDTIDSAMKKIDESTRVVYVQPSPPTQPKSYESGNTNVVDTYYVVNCDKSITLRATPSTSAADLAQIPLGQAVGYIENAGNGFYKINYNGKVGYSLAQYLSSVKPDTSSSSNRIAQVVNADQFITLRSEPSKNASEITKIPAGAYVTYLGTASNGFYHIQYNGMTGYGLQSYLKLN